jgi:uncharacterized protein (TIGR02246 family)
MQVLIHWMAPLAFAATLFAQTPDRVAIENAVLETSAQMTRAAENLDADRLFSFMLPNDRGSIVQYGNVLLTREQALAQTKENLRGISKLEYRWKQQYVTVVSPTVALLVAEGESHVTTGQGETFSTPFAQTLVLVLTGGQWKVLHAHQSAALRR